MTNIERFVSAKTYASNKVVDRLDRRLQTPELRKAINNLKNGKAVGKDLVMNEMLKSSTSTLAKPLLKFFNMCVSTSIFPES